MGLSRQEKIFLIAAGLISLLVWFLLVSPQLKEASRLKGEMEVMSHRTKEARDAVQAAERIKAELEANRAKIDHLDHQILPRRDLTRILGQLTSPAREHRIQIISMKPVEGNTSNPGTPYQGVPIEIEIRCRYLDLGRYLEDLQSQSLLFTVESLQITSEGRGSSLLYGHMVLSAYIWRNDASSLGIEGSRK